MVSEVFNGDCLTWEYLFCDFSIDVDEADDQEQCFIARMEDEIGHGCHELNLVVLLLFSHLLLQLLDSAMVEVVEVEARRILLEDVPLRLGVFDEVADSVFG